MESDLIKHYLQFVSYILLFTILILPSSYAVTLTDTYISGYGIASGIHEGYYTHFQFENYCPMCGCHGTLQWNPKGTREGEITCSHCDSDYSVSGKEKLHRPRAWLTPYVPEPEPSVPETVPPPEPTPWQKAHTCFKNNQII